MAAGTEAGRHRIVSEEVVYPSLLDSPADGLGLIFLINEISWYRVCTNLELAMLNDGPLCKQGQKHPGQE